MKPLATGDTEILAENLRESILVKQRVLETMLPEIATAADWTARTLRAGGKLLLVGNGGSAADAQHVAAELVGRFERERRPWPAIALTTDSSVLTAIGNDYAVEEVFSRQVRALATPGDLLFAFSTSGTSRNVLEAARAARAIGARVIGLTGASGGALAEASDLALRVPSHRAARIQEAHITICHAICAAVERDLSEQALEQRETGV